MKRHLILLLALIICSAARAAQDGTVTPQRGVADGGYDFWMYAPDSMEAGGRLPLVICLHGASYTRKAFDKLLTFGTLDAISRGCSVPSYVITPHNTGGAWSPKRLDAVLEWAKANCSIDSTRVYVIGMSLGGYGTLDFAGSYPEKIAAAIGLCGGTTLRDVAPLGRLPLFLIHGTADRAVRIGQSKSVVSRLKAGGSGSRTRHFWIRGGDHGLPARFFYLQKSYDWLFSHATTDEGRKADRHIRMHRSDIADIYRKISPRGTGRIKVND